jgi:crossover junction endodeoxyribonuclease RuvC
LRVLGVDPGTVKMGIGIVDSDGQDFSCHYYGVISPKRSDPIEKRLAQLFNSVEDIIINNSPGFVAVEEPFVSRNARTAIAIGQAQAVVLVAASRHQIPVARYAPQAIKKSVTDYGHSSKEQVGDMVKLLLNEKTIEGSDDATDALAVAICHHNSQWLNNLIGT